MIRLNTIPKFQGWPSGQEREVIGLSLSSDELRKRYGIENWEESFIEGLNTTARSAYFIDDQLGPVVFVHYHMPTYIQTSYRTSVCVDSGLNVEAATARLTEVLSLSASDITLILQSSDFVDLWGD